MHPVSLKDSAPGSQSFVPVAIGPLLSVVLSAACFSSILTAQVGTFTPTGMMAIARDGHTATLLKDGRVLVAGGDSAVVELYDPKTGSFTTTGPMTAARRGHSATLLSDGRVLMAGGSGLSTAEVYDPSTETFTATGSLIEDQFGHAALLLNDGRVLVAGGERSAPPWPTAARAELYDPTTGTFSLTGTYAGNGSLYSAGGPVWPTASLLADGRVLLAGENPAEIYDPQTGTFTHTGRMTQASYNYGMIWQAASSLGDGTVLVTGGSDDLSCGGIAAAEVYEPSSGTFRGVGPMTEPRDLHTSTLLPNGMVLIAGGGDGWCGSSTRDSAELYDPSSGTFKVCGKMTHSRSHHTATLLNDGSVLIAGGMSYWPATVLRSAELYRPLSSEPRRRNVRH